MKSKINKVLMHIIIFPHPHCLPNILLLPPLPEKNLSVLGKSESALKRLILELKKSFQNDRLLQHDATLAGGVSACCTPVPGSSLPKCF